MPSPAHYAEAILFAKHYRLGLLLALGVAMSCPAPARAWTEFLSMDVLPENAGWTPVFDAGSSVVVNGGILTLTASSFREYAAPASWLATVDASVGYMIEFRMRILAGGNCYAGRQIGIWYHDNTNVTILGIDADRIYVHYPTHGQPFAMMDATLWHTYRIVVQGAHHQVFVDGALVLDYPHPGTGMASRVLMFGDFGECGYSQTEWDYVAYDTQAVVPVAQTTWGRLKTLYRGER